jgi:hypothetical protein
MKGHSPQVKRAHAMVQCLERGTPRASRRAIAIGRTGFWVEQLMRATQSFTPYALGKRLQPDTYRKNEHNDPFNHNLWAKYAAGTVVPSPKLLREVEAVVPGSAANFRHVLFDVLDPATPIRDDANLLFRRMHPGVQRAVFEPKPLKLGYYHRRKALTRVLHALENQGHLDALAAAILLLREAQAARQQAHAAKQFALAARQEEQIFDIGNAVHRALLIACTCGPGTSVGLELIVLIWFLSLSLVASFGRKFATTVFELDEQCHILGNTILRLEDNYQIGLAPAATLEAAVNIFRGDYGEDLRLGLAPRLASIGEPQALPLTSRRDLLRDEILGGWARRVLRSYRVERLIPDAVMIEMSTRWNALAIAPGASDDPATLDGDTRTAVSPRSFGSVAPGVAAPP